MNKQDTFTIIYDFDEYHAIIPPNSGHDHIEILIDNSFEKDELILCIIENVTIGNIQGVGDTHLRYLKKEESYLKEIVENYTKVIHQMKNHFDSLSSFFDWYQRNEALYIEGKNHVDNIDKQCGFRWISKRIEEKPKYNDYVKNKDAKLSNTYFSEFISKYIELLKSHYWFKNLPFYTIIIKPISVYNEKQGNYIPLGNLYLHFGTNTKKEKSFYEKLVNQFMTVWFRNHGAKIVQEITDKTIIESKSKISTQYLPNFITAKNKNRISKTKINHQFTLLELYETLFDIEEFKHFQKYIITENFEGFQILNSILDPDKKNVEKEKMIDDFKYKIEIYSSSTLEKHTIINDDCIIDFAKIISKRRIALALFLLFEQSLENVHKIIIRRTNTEKSTLSSMIDYLWNKLFIPYKEGDTLNKNKDNIYKTLSSKDLDFLKKLYLTICITNPNFKSYPNNFSKNTYLQ